MRVASHRAVQSRPRVCVATVRAALGFGVVLLAAHSGLAQSASMRDRVYSKLSRAEAAAEAGDFNKAFKHLGDVDAAEDLTGYERAQLHTAFGFAYYRQEKLNDSVRHYALVLEQEDLPPALETGTLYTLAQLHFRRGSYIDTVYYLELWLAAVEDPGPDAYILLGQAHHQLEDYEDAIVAVRQAISIQQAKGREARQNWYLLLRVLHFERKEWEGVRDTLEILVLRYPKKEYWVQLAAMYGLTGDEERQLATYEIAWERGYLERSADLVLFAQLLMQGDMPYWAATVLEESLADGRVEPTLRNRRLLSQAWVLAREEGKAIATLRDAGSVSEDGEVDARLAQLLLASSDWAGAEASARAALAKDVENAPGVEILLGMALFEQGRLPEARSAFERAQASLDLRAAAIQWIQYIEAEEQRQEELSRALQ